MFRNRRPVKAMFAAAALTTTLGLVSVLSPVASAQEASPAAAPITVCNSPGLAAGEAAASPAADAVAASPVAAPVGTPADEATTEEVTNAALNLVACFKESPELGLGLVSTNFLTQVYGTDDAQAVLASGAAATGPDSFANFETGDVFTYEDGSVSIDVQYDRLTYQVVGERLYFTGAPGSWVADGVEPITPDVDGDTAVVGVNITDEAVEFNIASIVESEVVMLHLINAGTQDHELVIFRGSDTLTVDAVTADSTLLQDAEAVGALKVAPGAQADMALVGLEPGKYLAVDTTNGVVVEFEILGL